MPEGDTLFRVATRLRQVLVGKRFQRLLVVPPSVASRLDACREAVIERVESRGKHLLIALGESWTLHTHLGMTGSWHIYRLGAPWHKPRSRAALAAETDTHVVVCFSPKSLEVLSAWQSRHHRWLNQLGTDFLAEAFDVAEVRSRFQTAAQAMPAGRLTIGVALLDQRLACGVGNIYKSEVLFLCHCDPRTPVDQLTPEELTQILLTSRQLLQRNCGPGPRTTRWRGEAKRLWVYAAQVNLFPLWNGGANGSTR